MKGQVFLAQYMAYKRLFAHLAAGEVPIVFHCTAGKDRTGVAAMLILPSLGVSEEDALYDYLLTNVYLAQRIWELVAKGLGVERYGTYEAYFAAEYGLDAQGLAALRDRYTE